MDELDQRLKALDGIHTDRPIGSLSSESLMEPPGHVPARRRRPPDVARRAAIIVVAFGLFLASSALLLVLPGNRAERAADQAPADELAITCTSKGAVVTDSRVLLRSDGLHISIKNPGDHGSLYMRDPERVGRSVGMEIRRSPGVRVLASVQPGRWVVGCLPGDVNLNDVPLTKYSAPVQVVDPKGYWPVIEDRQSCGERLPAPGPAAGTDAPLAGPLAGRFVLEFFDGEKGGIVSVNADGSDPVRLTAEGRDVDSAVWSPDGSRVAFLMQDDADGDPTVYDAALEDSEIYVMGADGGNLTRLTENRHSDDIVRWNPDGTRLSFRSNRDGDHRLYTMRTDGTDVRPLTPAGWTADSHSWSPDGSRFAFVGGDGEDDGDGCFFAGHEDLELYLMNADGSGAVRLTDDELYQQSPVWSPDGSKVAFAASNQSDYAWEIFVVNADGSGLWRLTDYPGYDMGPVWSPDGSMIGFTSDRSMGGDPHGDHQGGIPYVMNADGSGVRPLFTIDQLRSMGLAPEYDVWVEAWLS